MDKLQIVKRQAETLAHYHPYYLIFIVLMAQVWLVLSALSQPFPKQGLKGKRVFPSIVMSHATLF